MATTQERTIVYPEEEVRERYVTRKFLGWFKYDKIISRVGVGYRLFIHSHELPLSVHINGDEYIPLKPTRSTTNSAANVKTTGE